MPEIRAYEVEQTRIVIVHAMDPVSAVVRANQSFEAEIVPDGVRITSVNARESF